MRKISKTLALMGILAPLGANALGIGEIKLHSALNQTLNAEIPLRDSNGEEISDLKVSLGSQEAFARAGIDRNFVLTRLRFTPQQKADGSYVIRVSSKEAIREPFLNFIIEIYWPQGRMQREFTVLLDPPASFRDDTYASEDLPEAEISPRTYQPAPVRPQNVQPAHPKPRRVVRENREPPPQPVAKSNIPISGTRYGPVNRNETLWSIAKRFNRNASVTQDQMLVALYKANPNAFYRNDMNALKAGETLTIPDQATLEALIGVVPSGTQGSRLASKSKAHTEQVAAAPEEPNPRGQLKLLAPGETKSQRESEAASGEKGRSGKSKEEIALEVADTAKQESEEIRSRLAELEQKLAGMQRLLSLKDEQISNLQAVKQNQPPSGESAVPPVAQAPAQPPMISQPQQTAPSAPAGAQATANQSAAPLAPPNQPETTSLTAPTEAPKLQETAKPELSPRPVAKPAPVPPAPPVTPPKSSEQEEGSADGVLKDPSMLLGGASVLLLLSAGAWYFTRRRSEMAKETESILNVNSKVSATKVIKSSGLYDTNLSSISDHTSSAVRSSFLSEFTPSDFEALGGELEDVDPVSEADVYLAYGRYKQAEELIRSAIDQNPERDDCKLKLLEIHYSTENAQAFEKFAEELAPTHRLIQPDFWEKVVEMGQELCPDSPLFMEHEKSSQQSAPSQSLASLQVNAMAASRDKRFAEDNSLLEAFGYPVSPPTEGRDGAGRQPTTLTHDFFSTSPVDSASAKKSEAESEAPLNLDNIIPFDSHQTKQAEKFAPGRDKTLDEILEELGAQSKSEPFVSKSPILPEADVNLDFDLGLELTETPSVDSNRKDSETTDFITFTETDEQETKLDLAKAYFDMGETEEARAILENVATNGTPQQKEEAWNLLNSLSRHESSKRQ